MLSQPLMLMILPACLAIISMATGFVLWAWVRGMNTDVMEDLQDELVLLRKAIKNNSGTSELLEMQFECQELRAQNSQLQEQTESISGNHGKLRQEMDGLKTIISAQESECSLAEESIRDLKTEVQDANKRNETMASQIKMLKEDLRKVTSEKATLKTTKLAKQLQANEKQSQEVAAKVSATDATQRTEGLATTYAFVTRNSTTAQLDNETLPVILRPEFPANSSHSTTADIVAMKPESSLDIEYGGKVERSADMGLVYTRPPMVQDNLQLISGIASVLEQQLNNYGVYTFQQIMLWDQNNIDQFSKLLNTFQDRIERDDWVGQAKSFYHKCRAMRQAG